ncbi:MAG: DUF2703 domain-containing protein [Anaerolineae bacterium]
MQTLHIRWERLVENGQTCPRCRSTEEGLEQAVSTLRQALGPLGLEVVLEKEALSEAQFAQNPLRSNQIWLNGRPLEEWLGGTVGQSPCCDVCGPADCRTVEVEGQVYEAIPADLVVKAGLAAALETFGRSPRSSCYGGSDPAAPSTRCCP